MVRKHGEHVFTQHVENASTLSEFFFDHFTASIDLASLDGRARLVQQAQPIIETMPEGVFRDMMNARLESLAQHRLQHHPATAPVQQAGVTSDRGKPVQIRTPLRTAMAHLVQNPSLVTLLKNTDEFRGPGNQDIQGVEIFRELVDFCAERPNITSAQLFEHWHEHPALPHLEKLAVWHLPGDEDKQVREFIDATNRIRLNWVEILLSRVTNIMLQRDEYRALQQRRQALKKQLEDQQDQMM
jgi:DNA primase